MPLLPLCPAACGFGYTWHFDTGPELTRCKLVSSHTRPLIKCNDQSITIKSVVRAQQNSSRHSVIPRTASTALSAASHGWPATARSCRCHTQPALQCLWLARRRKQLLHRRWRQACHGTDLCKPLPSLGKQVEACEQPLVRALGLAHAQVVLRVGCHLRQGWCGLSVSGDWLCRQAKCSSGPNH